MLRVPRSTYRLQLHAGFTFAQAMEIASYVRELGVSHVYSSPYLQAAPGSMHGYNVVDHERVNEELGGEDGHRRFCARLKELGLGQILDIVPNHMATGPQNRYWWDVLENGPSSRYAIWFDIDWHSAEVKLQNKVLIPVLSDQYGRVLSANQLQIEQECGRLRLRYFDDLFPLAPRSLAIPLAKAASLANNATLNFIADSLSRLPAPELVEREIVLSRHRDKTVIYELLQRLCAEQPEIAGAIATAVGELNRNIDALDEVLNLQHYRLAYWRAADQELGYRRFFDVNTLIGLRVERQDVFDAIHQRIFQWLEDGELDGVRVDHPDGLRDPQQYFERLRRRAPDAWIIAEKILEPGEWVRSDWPIAGTSGYDFLNVCNGVLMHTAGLQKLTDIYREFLGESIEFEPLAHNLKLNVEREALGSDINRLTSLFVEVCENNRDRRDYTRAEIRRAIREIASSFRVYRTYVVPSREQITDEDRTEIDRAVLEAKASRTDLDPGLLDFIGDVLALRARGPLESEFLLRFQQFTSPVMAKGVEDTAFYCYNRMIGLNEVGGSPERGDLNVSEFHGFCERLQAQHPATMNTMATHDTKRGDDVRARLAVLTEMPDAWSETVRRWAESNAHFKTANYPDRNTEYFLYQTLVGAWPIGADRLVPYMEKAAREAKQMTSWTLPNKEFEEALKSFIEQILDSTEFVAAVDRFVGKVLWPGRINSLAQTLMKMTAPGVPDTYQGGELWDLRLVDPDNRGPVDYAVRQTMLAELKSGRDAEWVMSRIDCGLPKMWITHCALQLRNRKPEWFGEQAIYARLETTGPKAEHVIAFRRGENVVTCVPRWNALLGDGWGDTLISLPEGRWTNELTGEGWSGGPARMEELFRRFPVALLTGQAA
ncbi:MAG TPA: malto-oligosyltrehalose synthase [Terracidiphilus sp.]|jgi:(1->4)-alpha-D-glucan 1-alpha-D-glucosylmutase|nr:malto-oligosyltrehalose synthase [Terracidiphilus sp.]